MRERLPDWFPERRMFPRPQPVIVMDYNNTAVVTRYLHDVDRRRAAPDFKRMVIRPTPGAGDRTSLGLDLMAALGKNPDLLRQDKLGSGTWELAGAWLIEAGVTDVFLDRAHTLPTERIQELLELSIALKASLWLIWGGTEPTGPVETLIADAGFRGRVDTFRPHGDSTIATDELHGALPLPDTAAADRDRILTPRAQVWPVLPSVDFPTFRAACRRHLPPSVFARVDAAYLDAADRVDTWISDRITTLIDERPIPTDADLAEQAIARAHQLVQRQAQWEEGLDPGTPATIGSAPPAAAGAFEWAGRPRPIQLRDLGPGQLTSWLRDTQLGPADADGLALITLRATQAALLRHGLLLAWNPGPLGPDPNTRLRGDLTRLRANALYALGRTEHAAATALSLHLNHPPTVFGCWRCGDIAPDGSTLRGGPHRHRLGNWGGDAGATDPCATTVRVPEPARRLLVAHLAYRRIQGAGTDDPFFINTRDAARSPASMLRSRAGATCRRLNVNAPWLHTNNCRFGADVGLTQRSYGWLQERGLSLHQLTPGIPDSPQRHWPATIGAGAP